MVDSFTDGTLCDLSREPRTTKITYECGEVPNELIHSVEEVSTCKYGITVKTPKLCIDIPTIRIPCHVDIPAKISKPVEEESPESSGGKTTKGQKSTSASKGTAGGKKRPSDKETDPQIKILSSANLGRITAETEDLLKFREQLVDELTKLTAKMASNNVEFRISV